MNILAINFGGIGDEVLFLPALTSLKKQYPDAKVLVHPECKKPVQLVADYVGSTARILHFSQTDPADTYIVATEPGILHQMRRAMPQKTFIPAPPVDSTCGCNDCVYMKLITLKKIYLTLKYGMPEITVDEEVRKKAERSIRRMLELSK